MLTGKSEEGPGKPEGGVRNTTRSLAVAARARHSGVVLEDRLLLGEEVVASGDNPGADEVEREVGDE